jgi:hypothetical protein
MILMSVYFTSLLLHLYTTAVWNSVLASRNMYCLDTCKLSLPTDLQVLYVLYFYHSPPQTRKMRHSEFLKGMAKGGKYGEFERCEHTIM